MIGLLLAGFLAGIISGMGIGGGAILIPTLLYLQDMNQQQAQGINLIYFIPTAIIALFTHVKNKNIEGKVALPIAITGLIGAATGAFLAIGMNSDLLGKFFGWFLLIMGLSEIFKKSKDKEQA